MTMAGKQMSGRGGDVVSPFRVSVLALPRRLKPAATIVGAVVFCLIRLSETRLHRQDSTKSCRNVRMFSQ